MMDRDFFFAAKTRRHKETQRFLSVKLGGKREGLPADFPTQKLLTHNY